MTEGGREHFPLARSQDLLVEQVGAETVVYDGRSKEAHCLSPVAAIVFGRSDGRTSLADLAAIASAETGETVDVALVDQALTELEQRDLIVAPEVVAPEVVDGISRRQFARRTAVAGGAALALPLVTSVVLPAYGQAQTVIPGETALSHVSACFSCPGGVVHRLKFEFDEEGGSATAPCSDAGNFTEQCSLTCTPTATTCPAGYTATENANGTVTFVFAANCQLTDYTFKGNCAENNAPGCLNGPVTGDTLPASGPSYTTAATCTEPN